MLLATPAGTVSASLPSLHPLLWWVHPLPCSVLRSSNSSPACMHRSSNSSNTSNAAFFKFFKHSAGFTPSSQYYYILMYIICARMDTGYIMFGPTPDGWIGLVWVVRDAVGGGLWWDNPGIPCYPFGTIPFFINVIKRSVNIRNRRNQQIVFFCVLQSLFNFWPK